VFHTLRWVASALLGVLGAWLVACNYACIVIGLTRRQHHSMIPLIGGIALAAALLTCPAPGATRWAWLPLVVDPGCLLVALVLGYTAIATHGFRR
jgi:hypothetical protein